jgi:hypothetical protein
MATYEELYNLRNESGLKNKVTTACIIAAETVMNELVTVDNHANRLLWAKSVFANPASEAERMFMAILAANQAADSAVILAATDASIQSNVDDHIDLFADGS